MPSDTKSPNVNRNKRLREWLEHDLFNQNYQFIDTSNIDDNQMYNVVDLFSGCGGMTLGFRMAGYTSMLSVEIDPDSSNTYRHNFPEAFHYEGLIENLTDEEALEILQNRQVHVLCAGFPCQGFSLAGARNSDDDRNQLFWQFVRFAKLLQPCFVVGENVANIVTMDNGNFYRDIVGAFADAGYPGMSVQILESAEYGVPQLRQRAIFIGNRHGYTNPFPKPILSEKEFIPIEDAIDDLKSHPRDPSINHEWTRHSKEMIQRISAVQPGNSLYDTYADAWKRQYRGVPSMTIKENHGGVHIHHELNRTISAREMARLQSFPDDFIFSGRMKRAMFQIGNAVPPVLAQHVALALKPSLSHILKAQDS